MRATRTIRLHHDTHRDLRAFAVFHQCTMDDAIGIIGKKIHIRINATRCFWEEHGDYLANPFPCASFLKAPAELRNLAADHKRASHKVRVQEDTHFELQAYARTRGVTLDRAVKELMADYFNYCSP